MEKNLKSENWLVPHPDKVASYFKREWWPLTLVTISGLIYNVGMTAGPYFEGQLVQRLFDIMKGKKTVSDMVRLALIYLIVILVVQSMRCVKRFYVRRFANNTSRNMRHMIYNSLVYDNPLDLQKESVGTMMTKAISDVDACAEGMRKFTTELFDTGIALLAYLVMLFYYDWKLAILATIFTPAAYFLAEHMKKKVYYYNKAYKQSAGKLNDATMDRVETALTYRVFGQESNRNKAYDERLKDYAQKAVKANIWENTMQPMYQIISMTGVIFIIYFGAKNVSGTGWTSWNIGAFTTFMACFAKLAIKSSKAAKLFNSVQKAKVSWIRIKPLMKPYIEPETAKKNENRELVTLEVAQPQMNFKATAGQIVGVTGPVASGKSTFARQFLCEAPYEGQIKIMGKELSSYSDIDRSQLIAYQGHKPELMSDSLKENIALGGEQEIGPYLQQVCIKQEVSQMEQGEDTQIGNGGVRLSGGQQDRVALARTLYQNARILVLDDPFSAVDQGTEREIFEQLKVQNQNRIILLLTHRLSLFPQLDQVIWMGQEQTQVSDHRHLMEENNEYRNLYELQTNAKDLDEEIGGGCHA